MVTPAVLMGTGPPVPPVLIPAINVVIPVILATFTIFGAPFPTVPLLFIYQPKTIDKAIALPGDVLLLSSVAISVDPPPTLILIDEYAVKIPTVLTPVADDALILPVRLPSKVVAVATPVTIAPLEKPTADVSSLFTISSTCNFDMDLYF